MKLYDYYRSSACYRVRIALNLKQISYDAVPVHLINHQGEQHFPEYLAINPQGLVPTLDENGHILTQSLAIIEYLEEINPEPTLLPPTPLGRAMVRSLAFMVACDIHPVNNLRITQELRNVYQANDEQVLAWYHRWLRNGFDALETKLQNLPRKNPVCYGQDVSIADICLIPQVYNANRFHFPMESYPLINEINAYCTTIPEFVAAYPESVEAKSG